MSEDLVSWARGSFEALPIDEDAEAVVFTPSTLPPVPGAIETRDLVIRRGAHDYDTWRIDFPQWFGEKTAFGSLGLAVLAVLLHQQEQCEIRLLNPASEIRSIMIGAQQLLSFSSDTGLRTIATEFRYSVSPVLRHPWVANLPPSDDLPWFKLTNSVDHVGTEAERLSRDVIHGFGGLQASARLARLFLDMSRPASPTSEVVLECEAGFRGVAPASCEARFWLPGSDFWDQSWFAQTSV
jgi:hypothetical protein